MTGGFCGLSGFLAGFLAAVAMILSPSSFRAGAGSRGRCGSTVAVGLLLLPGDLVLEGLKSRGDVSPFLEIRLVLLGRRLHLREVAGSDCLLDDDAVRGDCGNC